ncbi:hypothetical protein HUU59_02040 [bacterium]|nr:hypothetical protein [bacterium]
MINSVLARKLLSLFVFACAIALFIGCSNDDDNPAGDDSDHAEAFGCVLILGTDTLATADTSAVTGSISLSVNDTLGPIEVWFLDENGELFRPEHDVAGPLDVEEHGLDIRVANTTIADARLGHEVSEDIEWAFYLDGLSEGATTLRVVILHEGHDDFTSALFPLTVTP